jgi:hypothetical protein
MLWLGGATQKAEKNIQALRLLNQSASLMTLDKVGMVDFAA